MFCSLGVPHLYTFHIQDWESSTFRPIAFLWMTAVWNQAYRGLGEPSEKAGHGVRCWQPGAGRWRGQGIRR